jgi:hypothetical protein
MGLHSTVGAPHHHACNLESEAARGDWNNQQSSTRGKRTETMVSQRDRVGWQPEMSQDGADVSTSPNLNPGRTNAGGRRPPLPSRSVKPYRPQSTAPPPPPPPPPSLPSLSSQRRLPLQRDDMPPNSLLDTTTDTADASVSPTRSVGTVVQQRRESVRDGGEQWRNHGKLFRARLLMKDEEMGGNFFVLSNDCDIERYYEVADKVRQAVLVFDFLCVGYNWMCCDSYLTQLRFARYLTGIGSVSFHIN